MERVAGRRHWSSIATAAAILSFSRQLVWIACSALHADGLSFCSFRAMRRGAIALGLAGSLSDAVHAAVL
jgi:hypothetical protein